jgi:DNA-binding MarR family transcriptional regulator
MTQKEALEFLQENGDSEAKRIANRYDVDPGSIMSNMRSLKKKGLVDIDKSSSPAIYILTEQGEEKDPEDLQGMII